MTAPLLLANSELVAVAWLKAILADATPVGTTLPSVAAVAPLGFVQVSVVGGSPSVYIAERRPAVQVDFWAVTVNSQKPPWHRANTLAERVLSNCYLTGDWELTLPGDYPDVIVASVYPLTEIRRIASASVSAARDTAAEGGSFARYSIDLTVIWQTAG